MPCDVPVLECFEWHVKPRLFKPRISDAGTSVRALCPAHDDSEHSLGVSVVDGKRIVWNCFACDNQPRVRLALIRVCGIDPGCLRLSKAEREDVLDQLERILTAPTSSHANVRLRALAALEGYRDLPGGDELRSLAGRASVALSKAYEFRKAPLSSTDNPCSYPSDKRPVKSRRPGGRAA